MTAQWYGRGTINTTNTHAPALDPLLPGPRCDAVSARCDAVSVYPCCPWMRTERGSGVFCLDMVVVVCWQDGEGLRALDIAVRGDHSSVISLLLAHGASVSRTMVRGCRSVFVSQALVRLLCMGVVAGVQIVTCMHGNA